MADFLAVARADRAASLVTTATAAGRLPHVRLGRYVRYGESAIRAWLAAEEQRIARERRG